jgi:tetratricopeptide (TPR) repeat protein
MTAEAYLRVANIRSQLGQDAQAKQNYRHALQVLRRLAAEFPNDADYRCSLARCLSELAFMSAETAYGPIVDYQPLYFDTIEENEEAFRQAIKLQEKLVAEDPTRADYQWDLAVSYKRLGNHLGGSYNRNDQAEKLVRSAFTICSRLVKEHPTVLTYRQELCDLLGHLGGILMDIGNLPEAERMFRESLDRRKKLVDDFPGQTYPRYCLGWGYQDLATLQARTHRLEAAAENYRQAAEIRAKLAADFPGIRKYQTNLAINYGALAMVWCQMDRFQEAEHAYEKALAVREALARDYPAILDYAWARSGTQTQLGEFVLERGRPEAALALHGQAIAAMKKLLADQPQHMRARRVLLQALEGRADALITLGRLKELEQIYKDLEQHYEQVIKRDPSDHWDWFCLAPLHLQRGDIEGYRRVCREMLARFSQTDNAEIAERIAKTCLIRPDAVSDLGPVQELADRAVTGTKENPFYPWLLLVRGMADYRAGAFENAIARLNKCLSLAGDPRYRLGQTRDPSLAGTAYVFLAMAHKRLGHAMEARHWFDRATQVIQQVGRRTTHSPAPIPAWSNWLRFLLVYPEAEQLVRGHAEARK